MLITAALDQTMKPSIQGHSLKGKIRCQLEGSLRGIYEYSETHLATLNESVPEGSTSRPWQIMLA